MKCIYCEKEFEWRRRRAEDSRPKDCEDCRKNNRFAESILLDIKTKISYHKDQAKAYEFAKKIEKQYEEFAKDEEIIHFSKFW